MTKQNAISSIATKTTMKQKAIAILLALALVAMQSPIGYAGSSSDSASDEVAANEQGVVELGLDLQNASIIYAGQTISYPATKVNVPLWQDFQFSVVADTGYEAPEVRINVNGADQALTPNENGVYTIADADVAGMVKLQVSAAESADEQNADAAKAAEEKTENAAAALAEASSALDGDVATASDEAAAVAHDSAAVSLASAEDSSSAAANQSSFVFKKDDQGNQLSQTNTWAGTTDYSINDITESLSDALNYAVFANTMTKNIHLEGNVKVGTLVVNNTEQLNQDSAVVQRNAVKKIVATKTLEEPEENDVTFDFGLFEDGNTTEPYATFSITIPAGEISGSVTLDETSAPSVISKLKGSNLTVYEIGYSGTDATYEVTYSNNTVSAYKGSAAFNNEIGTLVGKDGSTTLSMDNGHFFIGETGDAVTYLENMTNVTFGGLNDKELNFTSGNTAVTIYNYGDVDSQDENGKFTYLKQKNGITQDVSSKLAGDYSAFSASLAKAKNGAKEGTGSLSVINLESTAGNLQDDLSNANFYDVQNGQAIKNIINDDAYLLINIDATGKDSYTLTKLIIDGLDPDSANEELARHVVYNFVQKSGDSYVPYTGSVAISNVVGGTILAPQATVVNYGGIRGGVISDTLRMEGSELHKNPISRETTAYVNVLNVKKNTFEASVSFAGKKAYEGAKLTAGLFNFTLSEKATDGSLRLIETVQNDANGNISFNKIKYTQAGEHTYVVQEAVPSDAVKNADGSYTKDGVTYDAAERIVKVSVVANAKGELTANIVEDSSSALVFTNSYATEGTTTLTATKLMDGRDFQAGDTYIFTVEALDGAPEFTNSSVTIDPTEGTSALIDFGTTKFTKAGTYTYVVSEAAVNANGVTSDPAPVTVTVTAVDNGKGTLDVTKTYSKNNAEATGVVFTNTYRAAEAKASLKATKVFAEGSAWPENAEYTFVLAPSVAHGIDGKTVISNALATTVEKSATKTARTVIFDEITYTQPGTYNYTITEKVPDGAVLTDNVWVKDGVAYDGSTHTATVTVTDNLDGSMSTSVTYDNKGSLLPVLTNSVVKTGETSASLSATKTLSGKNLSDGEFSFQLKDSSGKVLQTASNKADGSISFAPITYKEAGTYHYQIVEIAGNEEGVAYDSTVHTAAVTVTKNNDGSLSADVKYDNAGSQAPVFANTYFNAQAKFGFTKYFYGADMAQAFGFTLIAADENGNARTGEAEDVFSGTDHGQAFTLKATAAGFDENYSAAFDFGAIKYTAAGEYYYTVAEDAIEIDNVAMDETVYLVKVTVADDQTTKAEYKVLNGNGDWTSFDGETPEFYNNEIVTLSFESFAMAGRTTDDKNALVTVDPTAQKNFTDKESGEAVDLNEGQFSFDLVDSVTGEVLQTVGNAADGKIDFKELTYDKPGTYKYLVREEVGPSTAVTYDAIEFEMVVTVSADEEGALEASVVYTNLATGEHVDKPNFNNQFEGMDVKIQKVSREGGEGLADCTYALWMVTDTGDVEIAEATSDNDGWILFEDVDIAKGVKYYFKEVKAPTGHTVDPYRTAYFSLNENSDSLEFVEATAEDGWHPAGTKSIY